MQFERDVRTPGMNTGHIMCATGAKLAECVWGREMFEAKVAGATATHFEFSTFLHKFFFGGGGGGCSVFLYE